MPLPRPRSPHLFALVLAAAVLAGCAGDDPEVAASPPTTTPTQPASDQGDADSAAAPSPASPAAPEGGEPPAATPAGARVALDASCRLQPEGPAYADAVALSYPAGWDLGADQHLPCRFFDPEPVDLPEDSEAYGVALRWTIDPVAFADAVAPGEALEATRRLPTVVDERQAVRLTGTATGQAGLPGGAEVVVWLVDVSGSGADAEPATLVASADAGDPAAVSVLDRMVRATDIAPDDARDDDRARGATTVARYAGGGTPFAVAFDRASGCLELYAGARQGAKLTQACDLGTPDPLAAASLAGPGRRIAVGVTTSEVDVVRLRTNADTDRAVATVALGDGRRGFALPLSGTEPALVAETFDARVLGSQALGDAAS